MKKKSLRTNKKNEKRPMWILVAGLIAVVLFLILLSLMGAGKKNTDRYPSSVACTMEAKICPDGTTVGRSGPSCEFSACPTN